MGRFFCACAQFTTKYLCWEIIIVQMILSMQKRNDSGAFYVKIASSFEVSELQCKNADGTCRSKLINGNNNLSGTSMNLKKLSQAMLVAACFAAASASAATLTVSNTSNVIVSKDTDWSDFLNFAKFNTSLGTLTSVTFNLYSDINGSVSLTNYNDELTNVPFSLGATVALSRPDSSNLVLINETLYNTSVGVAAGDTFADSKTVNAHSTATFTNVSDLSLFTGTGNIATLISAKAWSSVEGDGIDAQFATKAGGYGTVTYTYTAAPVPEPETYGMLLLGLGVLGVVAKRKRAAKA
ncbi:choice-of-anchor E domain-containing protein [Duganella callida]|uniref:Choice-of-anchor E domain-containing protein n=2 Tax=Duganella callida TaxID=2561932 RepID=A0A4Y9RYI3_9BURK|nr:choice-of-anchor E domain-containing protein [Duganella callida]